MSDPLQQYELHSSSAPTPLNSSRSSSVNIHTRHDDGSHRNKSGERLDQLRSQLSETKKRLRDQELRNQEAKRELVGLTALLKDVNDKRIAAVREAQKANEELRLYKIQLQRAQQVIIDAQGLLDNVDRQRYQAEREAAKTRTALRRLNREVVLRQAMEEGRRIGLREGFERGKELELMDSQSADDSDSADEEGLNDLERDGVPHRPRSLFITSAEDVRQPRSPTRNHPLTPSNSVPVLPPEAPPAAQGRPRSFRSPSPIVYHGDFSIPPEGYIPALDSDHVIRIPPPHELSRPPPTPERTASPPLPIVAQGEPILPTRPRSDRSARSNHQRNSSLGSVSTSLSQLELVNGPGLGNPSGRRSPLSVIPEVPSVHSGSPNPPSLGAPVLDHKSSWAFSHQSNVSGVLPGQSSRSRAGSVRSVNAPRPGGHSGVQEYITPTSPAPPSTLLRPHSHANSAPHSPSEQAHTWGASPANSQVPLQVPAPMPGAYDRQAYEPPSPFTSAAQHPNKQDDNVSVSSGMSNGTLTTPVLGRRHY